MADGWALQPRCLNCFFFLLYPVFTTTMSEILGYSKRVCYASARKELDVQKPNDILSFWWHGHSPGSSLQTPYASPVNVSIVRYKTSISLGIPLCPESQRALPNLCTDLHLRLLFLYCPPRH